MRTAIYLATTSSPPIFATLFAGLIMAFAFQLLLTNLGVAVGITALGFVMKHDPSKDGGESDDLAQSATSESSDSGNVAGRVGFAIGFGTLLTVNTVLFLACFLAVKLNLIDNVVVGAILGIAIWSAYFLILVWLSSTTVSPLLGAVVGGVTASVRGLLSTIANALKAKGDNQDKKLADETAPPLAKSPAALKSAPTNPGKQEISAVALVPEALVEEQAGGLQRLLQEYLEKLQLPRLDLQTIGPELEGLLSNSDLVSFAGKTLVGQVDRATLASIISSRTDFAPDDIEQAIDLVENLWQKVFGQPQKPQDTIANFLETASPDQLTAAELNTHLSRWLFPETANQTGEALNQNSESNQVAESETPIQPGDFNPLFRVVLHRTDLTETDAERILRQIQAFQNQVAAINGDIGAHNPERSFSLIQLDVENYLLHAYPWQLKRDAIESEFKQVLYDSEADPEQIRQQLERLNPDYFKQVLKQRDDLKSAKINKIVDRLETVRQSVLASLKQPNPDQPDQLELQHRLQTESEKLWQTFVTYLRDPEQNLTARKI
ncbi:MAG: hypothetical protein WCA35_23715, partial [Kovacikia sp.]